MTDARGCSLWRSLLERPPPAPESRVRDPLGELVRTRVGGVTLIIHANTKIEDVYFLDISLSIDIFFKDGVSRSSSHET